MYVAASEYEQVVVVPPVVTEAVPVAFSVAVIPLDEFLKLHPGQIEVRPAGALPAETVLLASPSAAYIVDLLGSEGGEVWSLGRDEAAEFIRVPRSGERDRS